ncbi:MAG: gfo/Idh/MocA family oxidoreductase [Planctomycetota bacterium]|nr:MAG: gfo/Idh/MocA family oxidoreductase [Planctomycetota bacterium]REK21408.1 MAG: gfo/Idh/MocA family oxidoreductase [Planctomycetota bacterium]
MSEQLCRWGILGTAGIARKNWLAIRNTGNGRVTAVASRDGDRAFRFIDECQREAPVDPRPHACEGYETLLERDDVDAVYIPLPTGLRKEWVIRAAEAGKHVMCEKPCAASAADLSEMLAACNERNVQFMDGVMYMHSARMPKVREALDDGESVGRIRRIASHFSFCAPEDFLAGNIRVSSALEPQGCLGDLGWYTIRFSLFVKNYALPVRVRGKILSEYGRPDSPESVPTEFSGELFFDGGVSAAFYNSFLTEHQQYATVSGSKGCLTVSDFVLPVCGNELAFTVENSVFAIRGCDFTMESHPQRHSVREYSHSHPSSQETNLFRNFGDLVLRGAPDRTWGEIALKTQRVMDACLRSAREGGVEVEL